jgi:hypothetical protein
LSQGESPAKLAPFESLFRWYRIYGYSSGVAIQPSGCTDEYRSPQSFQTRQFDPQQEKMARDFLCGVGMTLSGVFCIVINPPLLGKFGVPLVLSGFNHMYDSVSCMIKDRREKDMRLKQLQNLQKSIENIAPKDKK